jgi:hypothetical protein
MQTNTSQEVTFYLLEFLALHFCVEFHGRKTYRKNKNKVELPLASSAPWQEPSKKS